jgi:hypothetical protein
MRGISAQALAQEYLRVALITENLERASKDDNGSVTDFNESELRWLAAFREQAK